MDELINKMVEKVGIDKATAEKVIDFLKDHVDDVGKYIASSSLAAKLPGGIGEKLGNLL